jgi:hypothetical protein
MKEWVTRYREYERVTKKTVLSNHPYSSIAKGGKEGEFLHLRDDFVDDFRKKERMNRYIGGGQQMSYSIEQRVIKRPIESLITRIKNKIKW